MKDLFIEEFFSEDLQAKDEIIRNIDINAQVTENNKENNLKKRIITTIAMVKSVSHHSKPLSFLTGVANVI